jgi:hypothetical protein
MSADVFKFVCCFVEAKNKEKDFACCKHLRILKIFPTAASEFMVWISYSAIGRFSPVSTIQPLLAGDHKEMLSILANQ